MSGQPGYVARFARLPRTLAALDAYPEGMPIEGLARIVEAPVEHVRAELAAYNVADVGPGMLMGLTRPVTVDFLDQDGAWVAPETAVRVRLSGPPPGQDLGIEYLDAAQLALLYTAGRDLLLIEPDDHDLRDAVEKLRRTVFGSNKPPPLPPAIRRVDETARALREAIGAQQRVEVRYSDPMTGELSTQVVEPYQLLRTDLGWELDAGPLAADGSIPRYLVERIHWLHPLDEEFETRLPDAAPPSAPATTAVTVRVARSRWWAAERYSRRVDLVRSQDDDVILSLEVDEPVAHRVALLLLSAGPSARALSPERLGDAGRVLAASLLAHHSERVPPGVVTP